MVVRCRVQWVVDVGFSGLSMPGLVSCRCRVQWLSMPGLVSCRCRVQWVVDVGFSGLSM